MTSTVPRRQPTVPADPRTPGAPGPSVAGPASTLTVAVLAFFVLTLDVVIVNVALPSIQDQLGGGIAGMQWVVDGYTLMLAALLLSAGVFTDRLGAKTAFTTGLAVFVVASAACAIAPNLGTLIAARLVQGAAAAVLMPSSMALIGQAFPDPAERARAIGIWAMGGAVAASSGSLLGGVLTLVSWRLIFAINLPVGLVALVLLLRVSPSPRRQVPIDKSGPILAVITMGALIFGTIEAGVVGPTDNRIIAAYAITIAGGLGFVLTQRRSPSPLVPPSLIRARIVVVTSIIGFAFVVGFFGLPFVMSLFLQQHRGLSPFETGLVFLPMMLVGALLTPLSARTTELFGARRLIIAGFVLMAAGLAGTALAPTTSPAWVYSLLMGAVGLSGPAVMPPAIALLLDDVPTHLTGTASSILNTSRQVGGALAIAVFGALLAPDRFVPGFRASLIIAASVALIAAAITRHIDRSTSPDGPHINGARRPTALDQLRCSKGAR